MFVDLGASYFCLCHGSDPKSELGPAESSMFIGEGGEDYLGCRN